MRRVNRDKAMARAKAKVEKMGVVERYTMFCALLKMAETTAGHEIIAIDTFANGYVEDWFGVDLIGNLDHDDDDWDQAVWYLVPKDSMFS